MKRIVLAASIAVLLASSAFAQLPKVETMDAAALYNRAVEYIKAKDHTHAVSLLREVLDEHEGDPAANFMMGVAQIGLNDLDEARRYLSRAVSADPDLAEARGRLGWVEAKLGNAEDAERHRAALVVQKTKCASACPEAAVIDASLAMLSGTATGPTVSAAFRFNQGIDALDAKNYAQAAFAFGEVLIANPDDWEAAYMRGQAQAEMGNLAGAKISFETALRVQPGVVDAKGRLGAIEKKLGNAQAAANLRTQLLQSQQRCGGTCQGAKQIDAAIAMIDAS